MDKALTFTNLAGFLLILLSGCASVGLTTKETVVEIDGVYRQEVIDATAEVMEAEGYKYLRSRGPVYLYEKPGSKMDYLAWGGWNSDQEVAERVSLQIRDAGPDAVELRCEPFIVVDPDKHMEEARKMSRMKSGKYRKLLESIKERCLDGVSASLGDDWD